MSYKKTSIYYNRKYPDCATQDQLNLVHWIESVTGIKCTASILGDMSMYIDASRDFAESLAVDDINCPPEPKASGPCSDGENEDKEDGLKSMRDVDGDLGL